MVKSYCVKQRKKTDCVPNSETLVQTKKWPSDDEM